MKSFISLWKKVGAGEPPPPPSFGYCPKFLAQVWPSKNLGLRQALPPNWNKISKSAGKKIDGSPYALCTFHLYSLSSFRSNRAWILNQAWWEDPSLAERADLIMLIWHRWNIFSKYFSEIFFSDYADMTQVKYFCCISVRGRPYIT